MVPYVTLIPLALLALACMVKFSVVLSLLGRAIGGKALPGAVTAGLAVLLAAFVLGPIVDGGDSAALSRSTDGVRAFLEKHTPVTEREPLAAVQRSMNPTATVTDHDLGVMLPAYALAGLKAAFRVGFFLLLPFLVIDVLIAVAMLGLGMHSLDARVVALPLKLLLFITVDGWSLVTRGLLGGA